MLTRIDTPRIYVACLASYNSGKLHGEWIDCDCDADEIREQVKNMLAESPEHDAEEWAIHDYENWSGLPVSEWSDFDELAEWARLLEEYGPAYGAYVGYVGEGASDRDFTDHYHGEFTEREFAEHLVDECYNLEGPLAIYFDYDAYARDLFCGSYFCVEDEDGTSHVFSH